MGEETGSVRKQAVLLAAVRPWNDAITASAIVLSAGTYLFDFISNVLVLVEYGTCYARLLHHEEQGSCDARCRVQTTHLAGFFYGLLAILVVCHSLNALLFKLKFTHNEAPLCAAYFLPLIHLYRLCNLLWRTLSCKGVQDVKHPEVNGLYCILGSAMEGVPMLINQFCAYLVLTQEGIFLGSMFTTFKVSLIAYMKFDKVCGPTTDPVVSILSQRQQYQHYNNSDTNEHKLIPMDNNLADGQTYSQAMMIRMEVDGDARVTLSSSFTDHTSASSDDEELSMASSLDWQPFPSEKHCACAPLAVALNPDVHFPPGSQLPCTRSLIAPSLSLDRGKGLTIARQLNPALATRWASFHKCFSSY